MARPAEFDRNHAVEAAMLLFWRQGYGATSLTQLLETTEIGRSSFYGGFGDKRSLFVEALNLFSERTRQIFMDAARESPPLGAIRKFFYRTLIDIPRARAGRGCMMVNTILELADVDSELSALAAKHLDRVEAEFDYKRMHDWQRQNQDSESLQEHAENDERD